MDGLLKSMKIKQSILVLLFAVPGLALAGIKIPSKVFDLETLEEAKTEAAAKGKPIAFLYTDKDSTCPLCNAASMTMMKELGNKTVMIYVRSANGLPLPVMKALEPGKFIPKIAVMDAKLEKSLGMVTYEAVKADSRKAFRDVEKAIKEYKNAD